MSSMDDELTEILGDFAPDAAGDLVGWRPAAFRPTTALRQAQLFRPQSFSSPSFGPSRFDRPFGYHHRKHKHRRYGGQQPGAPGALATTAPAPAPAGQPQGPVPIPPGNWPGGSYPPAGWSPGQPLPGYPQGWPPPGSPWPGTFQPGISNVPQPAAAAPVPTYDPYGNLMYSQPGQPAGITYDQYGNPIYPPGMPQPTIDVTVGAALDAGMKMSDIIGCLRQAGYTTREINGIVGACCGW